MTPMPITVELARAVAKDETERHMARQRRTVWSLEDYDLCRSIFTRILSHASLEEGKVQS